MKLLFVLTASLFFTACSLLNGTSEKEQTQAFNQFLKDSFENQVELYPTWQTYLGRKTNYGKLNNYTEEFDQKVHKIEKQTYRKLKQFDFDKLSEKDQLSYKIYDYLLTQSIEGFKWRYHGFPLNQMFGIQSESPSFLINMHSIDNVQDATAYISRLKEIQRVFNEQISSMKFQEKKGILPPKFVFSKVIRDAQNIITGKPFDKKAKAPSPLLKDFQNKISKLDIDEKKKDQLIKDAEAALTSAVKPAYQKLIAYAKELDKKITTSQGAWSLPEGSAYYNYMLKAATTTELDANQIHLIGLKEVERIHGEMKKIMKEVKFKGELKEFFKFMKKERFLYPQNANGRKAYLQEVNRVVDEMREVLPRIFHTLPQAKLVVKPVEPFREKSAGIAFYSRPSVEGNRPGIYYVNLSSMEDMPRYKLEALAYHEAIPGHHMQTTIEAELEDIPMFRKFSGFGAYVEGWGLYAEYLPKELGFYKDPYSDFGRLTMELWRATRLVVDTGIHAKKWSREKAIQYLKDNTPNGNIEIVKGVERYFVMPAQATSYKVGMMKILELKERAKQKLGKAFTLADFHEVILGQGSMPLALLEQQVEQWIESH